MLHAKPRPKKNSRPTVTAQTREPRSGAPAIRSDAGEASIQSSREANGASQTSTGERWDPIAWTSTLCGKLGDAAAEGTSDSFFVAKSFITVDGDHAAEGSDVIYRTSAPNEMDPTVC